MKEREVSFYCDGAKIVGSIFLPDDYKEGEKRPAVLVNSGWTGIKRSIPTTYARALTPHGFVCMGFDYRCFKPSESLRPDLPRYTTLEMQLEEQDHAFTFMQNQPEVDPDRCGIMGWAVGGAVGVAVAARNEEVKAVAMLNGFVNGRRWMHMGMGTSQYTKTLARLKEDRLKRITTGDPVEQHAYIDYPNIADDADYFTKVFLNKIDGGIKDEITSTNEVEEYPPPMSSIIGESFLRFQIEDALPRISPRPVFIGHGYSNKLHHRAEAEEAYRLAKEPKYLYYVDGEHNDWGYDDDPRFQAISAQLALFFQEHLTPRKFGLQK